MRRRFARGGISDVTDSEKKFAVFTQPLALDRFSPPVNYIHWSFDGAGSGVVAAEIAGISVPAEAATTRPSPATARTR